MGIPSFSRFVTTNDLRKPLKLCDTKVVIDGNNLLCHLYCHFNKHHLNDFLFGGNYNEYQILFKTFFANLDKCKIIPIMVFDGGFNLQLRDNRLKRFKEAFERSKKISDSPPPLADREAMNGYGITFPYLLKQSMISVLMELSIDYFMTKLDADNESAQLANRLECPLISNDSDFLVMNIDKGVIDCDSLKWETPFEKQNGYYIECSLYKVQDFVQSFNLKPEMLPIFASLMGNDSIKSIVFEDLFDNIWQTVKSDLLFENNYETPIRCQQMKQLLHWMKQYFICGNKIIEYIEEYYIKHNLKNFEDFRASLKSYQMNGNSILNDLLDHKKDIQRKKVQRNDFPIDVILNEYGLPKWFLMDYFLDCKFSSVLFSFIESKILQNKPLVEDFNFGSCYESSYGLYGFLLGLLRINRNDKTSVEITTRDGINIKEVIIDPKTHITHIGGGDNELPIFSEIMKLSQNVRKEILFVILGFNTKCMTHLTENLELIKFSAEDIQFWNYFLIVIKYWKSKTKIVGKSDEIKKSKFDFIRAILLSVIHLKHSNQSNDFIGLTSVPKQVFKPFITHFFCEFQSIYSTINNLSSLLGYPMPTTKLLVYLNGVLYYNLFNEIIDGHIKLWPFQEHRFNTLNNFILTSICIE